MGPIVDFTLPAAVNSGQLIAANHKEVGQPHSGCSLKKELKPLTTEPVTELEIVPLAAVAGGVPAARGLVPQLPALQQLQQQAAQQQQQQQQV